MLRTARFRRLKSLRDTTAPPAPPPLIVGPNGLGKSAILGDALEHTQETLVAALKSGALDDAAARQLREPGPHAGSPSIAPR
jgi:hypothetical protein